MAILLATGRAGMATTLTRYLVPTRIDTDSHYEERNRMDRLLTVKEAAELLACSEAAIRKWIYQRRLARVKVGRLTRLRQSDVNALVTTGLGSTPQGL